MLFTVLWRKQTVLARQVTRCAGSQSRPSILSYAFIPRPDGSPSMLTQVRGDRYLGLLHTYVFAHRLHPPHRRGSQGGVGCYPQLALPPAQREPGLPGALPLGAKLDRHVGQQGMCTVPFHIPYTLLFANRLLYCHKFRLDALRHLRFLASPSACTPCYASRRAPYLRCRLRAPGKGCEGQAGGNLEAGRDHST